MKPSEIINRTASVRKLQSRLDEYIAEHFVTDPETGVSESGNPRCDEYREWMEEIIEDISLFPPIALWRSKLPDEQGLWWWWNGDLDCCPLVVSIAYSGTDGSYFATQGQYGWEKFWPVAEMAGFWMPCQEPEVTIDL